MCTTNNLSDLSPQLSPQVGKHDYGLQFCKQYAGIVKNERNIGTNIGENS
jgi:hypothetical protein